MGNPNRIRPLTDEEEAEIQKQIASDPDDSDVTDEELAQARPFKDVFPDLYKKIERARGRPKLEKPKQEVSIRLDQDVIAKYFMEFRNDPQRHRRVAHVHIFAAVGDCRR